MCFCCCKHQVWYLKDTTSELRDFNRIRVKHKEKGDLLQKTCIGCLYVSVRVHVYLHIFFGKKKHTTNPNSNQIVRSAPPLAITRPAYITFIIVRKRDTNTNQASGKKFGYSWQWDKTLRRHWREWWETYYLSKIMRRWDNFKPITMRNHIFVILFTVFS